MAYSVDKLSTIDLGRQGENLARTVEIDVSSLLAQWPDAIISLLCKRKHDTVPYVAVTEVKDGMLIWPITSVETEAAGDGKIELALDADRNGTAHLQAGFVRVGRYVLQYAWHGDWCNVLLGNEEGDWALTEMRGRYAYAHERPITILDVVGQQVKSILPKNQR